MGWSMDSGLKNKLTEIIALALRLHGGTPAADAFTFRSLEEHVEEVRGSLAAGDAHWKAETLDIIIHGFLLLERHGVDIEEVRGLQEARLGRFKEKINAALR